MASGVHDFLYISAGVRADFHTGPQMERGQTLPRVVFQTPIRSADEFQDFFGVGLQVIVSSLNYFLLLLGIDKREWVTFFPLINIGMCSIIRFHFSMVNYL
jgi:hypothetical protein